MIGIGMATFVSVAVLLAPGSAWAASRHTARPRCAPGRARVVAADGQAEVYFLREPYPGEPQDKAETLPVYRGCVYGSRRSFRLGVTAVGQGSGEAIGTTRVT